MLSINVSKQKKISDLSLARQMSVFQSKFVALQLLTLCSSFHGHYLTDDITVFYRQMMSVCQSKFVALQSTTHGSSFHRAVDDMRHTSWQTLRKPRMDRRKTNTKGNWYIEFLFLV